MIGHFPLRKERIESSRSRWVRSPWIDVQGKPLLNKKSSISSAARLEFTKISVRHGGAEYKRSSRAWCLEAASTKQTSLEGFIISILSNSEEEEIRTYLLDVGMRTTGTTNADSDVLVSQMLLGQIATHLWEGC